jgi:hypothetical protein
MINLLKFNPDIKKIINEYVNNDKDIVYNLLNMNDNQLNLIFNFNHKYILERVDRFIEIDINKQILEIKNKFYKYYLDDDIEEDDNYLNSLCDRLEIITDPYYKLNDNIIKHNINMYLHYKIKKPKQTYIQC